MKRKLIHILVIQALGLFLIGAPCGTTSPATFFFPGGADWTGEETIELGIIGNHGEYTNPVPRAPRYMKVKSCIEYTPVVMSYLSYRGVDEETKEPFQTPAGEWSDTAELCPEPCPWTKDDCVETFTGLPQ